MMNKSAAEKLGLSPDEECIFLSVEKPMPAPSQTLLEEGKLGFKFDLFTETNSRSMLKYRRSLRFALQLIFSSRKRNQCLNIKVCSSFVSELLLTVRQMLSTPFAP